MFQDIDGWDVTVDPRQAEVGSFPVPTLMESSKKGGRGRRRVMDIIDRSSPPTDQSNEDYGTARQKQSSDKCRGVY